MSEDNNTESREKLMYGENQEGESLLRQRRAAPELNNHRQNAVNVEEEAVVVYK